MACCHSEPFDRLREESLLTPLTMRFFVALLLRMTSENMVFGWTLTTNEPYSEVFFHVSF